MSNDFDADTEIAQALTALKASRWRLSRASFALERRAIEQADPIRTVVIARYAGALNMLANTISHAATIARSIRKAVRSLTKGESD